MPNPAASEHLMSKRKTSSALEKALLLLEAIVDKDRPVALAYLVEELDLPKPTVHRTLMQLEEAALIQRSLDKDRYWIGPRLQRLCADTLGSRNQAFPTRGILNALVDELGETCNIGILDQHQVVYIDRVESNFPLRFRLQAGSRVPMHCTAIGKLMLAHLPENDGDRLLAAAPLDAFTDKTIVDRAELKWELARIRQQGYATNDQEYTPGMIAVAVPVTRADGVVAAALSVHAPVVRLTVQAAISHLPMLRSAADRLAVCWGWREVEETHEAAG